MKIITVIGARPQFIKAAAISKKIREKNEEILIHTGQHYDSNMSDIFFSQLDIPKPNYNLNIGSYNHGRQTGNMIIALEDIFIKEKPDLVLLYGDTNTTLAGAITASKLLIPIAHIEAGLRSYNKNMPEEQNRILTDHLSKYLFSPSEVAVNNLKKEGIVEGVYNTGDVMYDAIKLFKEKSENTSTVLVENNIKSKEYILATIHRAENTDNIIKLKNIIEAINESGENIVMPLHPRTKKVIEENNIYLNNNIKIISPVGYLDNIKLMNNSKKILTDSGGMQKEAYFLNIPCITLREETEWIETLVNGCNILVGADKEKILNNIKAKETIREYKNIYGDGYAADKILSILTKENTENTMD